MKKWKPDSSSSECNICKKYLSSGTFSSQKVHCRCCGEIVCAECSQRKVRYLPVLPDTPILHRYPAIMAVRVCDRCFKDPYTLFVDDGCPPNADPQLIHIYRLAKSAVIRANQVFPVSSSRQTYSNDYDPNLHDSFASKTIHTNTSYEILRGFTTESTGSRRGITKIEKAIQHCLKVSMANCYEMALYAYLTFIYEQCTASLDISSFGLYSLPLGDHVFLIVAPRGEIIPPGISNSYSFKDTHKNMIVCDPWRKMIFFLRNMYDHMGITFIENLAYLTCTYHSRPMPSYTSMKKLEDSVFNYPHKTTLE